MSDTEQSFSDKDIKLEAFHKQIEEELKQLDGDSSKKEPTEEVPESNDENTAPQYTAVELEQMEKGWDPNYKGPNRISAEEFKRVGEIIDAKRAASKKAQESNKEVVELTKTVKQLVEHNKAVEKAAYEKAKQELALKRIEKIQEGDIDAVLALEQEQQKLVSQSPPAQEVIAPPTPVISEEVKSFQDKYKDILQGTKPEDQEVRDYIGYKVYHYMQNEPNVDEKVAIAAIEEGMKKQFPSRFSNPNKDRPSMVGTSTTSSSRGESVALTFEEKQTLAALQKVDPTYTTAEFIKQIELIRKNRA